jgi:two-component system sensor histidine kinase CpxA
MKLRGSLYARLLLWLFLNLLLMGGLFLAVAGRSGEGWSMLLSQPVRERLLNVGERIAKDLAATSDGNWDQVLASYSVEYGVAFSVEHAGMGGFFAGRFGGPDGFFRFQAPPGFAFGDSPLRSAIAGAMPPPEAQAGAPPPDSPPGSPPGPPPDGPGGGGQPPPDGPGAGQGPHPPPGGGPAGQPRGWAAGQEHRYSPGAAERDPLFRYGAGGGPVLIGMKHPPELPFVDRRLRANLIAIAHPRSFAGYELRIPATIERDSAPPRPLLLLVRAATLPALLQFLGVTEWLGFALLVIALSALLWSPFIWGIARTVVRVTRATGAIADGRFDTRVRTRRRDELGRLAQAVNRMAERLHNYVAGQKQFLADVAHEVTSPLARMQLGLGLLEARLPDSEQAILRDVQEEAQLMSRLLDELLLYSRAGLQAGQAAPQPVELAPLLRQALQQEDHAHAVALEAPEELRALAQPGLLERAVANLVRNALRYAGGAEVRLGALREGNAVRILVSDRGPGVPAEALARLGEPFYRPDVARDRDSGGTGLGLAIVRRCVESCGGSVVFRNRQGGGFEAEIGLEAA